jgi:hypothetical protein
VVGAKEGLCALLFCYTLADLAQLVEHLICNQRVSGSNPLIGMGNQSRIMHNVASRYVPGVPFSVCFHDDVRQNGEPLVCVTSVSRFNSDTSHLFNYPPYKTLQELNRQAGGTLT